MCLCESADRRIQELDFWGELVNAMLTISASDMKFPFLSMVLAAIQN